MASQMHWIVVGGGFRGIVSAILLRQRGCEVTLIDQAPHLGGLLYGGEWEGFFIDRGAHLFDNVDDHITGLMHEILGEHITPVDVRYAVVMEDRKVDGLAVPDFTSLTEDQKQRALYELLDIAARPETDGPPPSTLGELFKRRFGPTLADLLTGPTRKMLRVAPDELAPEALITTPFRRVRFLPDAMTELLKQVPELDDRIVLPVSDDPLRHYRGRVSEYPHRNYYPTQKGMRGFCEAAETYLEKIGVRLMLGMGLNSVTSSSGKVVALGDGDTEVTAERLLWATPVSGLANLLFGENPLMGWASPVPMLLYYYAVPEDRVGPYEYMHDFSEQHLLFRPSAIGRHGGQVKADGTTYVCLEAVTDHDSAEWREPEQSSARIWAEAVELGVVSGPHPETRMVHKLPVTYVPAKPGMEERKQALFDRIAEQHGETIHALDQHAFSKIDIQNAIETWLK